MKKYFVSNFYKPKWDTSQAEEKFLLKRRIRLINKIKDLDVNSKWYEENKRGLEKKLLYTESKLGLVRG